MPQTTSWKMTLVPIWQWGMCAYAKVDTKLPPSQSFMISAVRIVSRADFKSWTGGNKGCPLKKWQNVECLCRICLKSCDAMQVVLKTLIQFKYFLKNYSQKSQGDWHRLLHGCRSWVGSDMLGRALSPCHEGTFSSWDWASAQFGLLTIPCKPTLLGIKKKKNPPLGGVWEHGEGFASCGTYGMKISSNKARVGRA